jgi:hypothetical protein
VDDADAGPPSLDGMVERDRPAVQPDCAPIRTIGAAQHFHESRFAGPVLAADRVNLAGPAIEMNVVQSANASKGLGDSTHQENR